MSSIIRKSCTLVLYGFSVLFILFVPFPFHFLPSQFGVTPFLLSGPVSWIVGVLRPGQLLYDFSSDSLFMYGLVAILAILAVLLTILIQATLRNLKTYSSIYALLDRVFVAYLALIWFRYGFEKILKTQFYLPEPNILYTPLGKLDPDILFWSVLGCSYSYNIVLGSVEIVAGIMLIFKPTRFPGLLLSLFIVLQILAINLCFDISLKLFTSFLLLVVLLLLRTRFIPLYRFLFLNKFLPAIEPRISWATPCIVYGIKIAFILLIFFEGLYPALVSNIWNDDLAPRPFLHGGYEVITTKEEINKVKRFFIHRSGYLIFQFQNDEMEDYRLEILMPEQELICSDYSGKSMRFTFRFSPQDSLIFLTSKNAKLPLRLKARAINWRALPAISSSFHWTVEGI